MRKLWSVLSAAVLALATAVVLPAAPASAAALTEVTSFGANPTGLRMHLYVPDRRPAEPALLVAVHYCTGSGPAFYSGSEFASLADQYGFIVIYPSATRSGNCFDVSSPGALTHNSTSDPAGIVSMVRYVQQQYHTDVDRTFVTGASSGGMMTNVLLGDYPDVFAAGSAFMGVPFGCFAATAGDPANPANQAGWNSTCSSGQLIKTPAAWGDLVRAAYPGYTGRRPRMQLFHGATDTTLAYPNFGEEIKQWTNVLGVSQTPVATDTPQSGWTRTRYGANIVQAPVEGISVANVGHSLPLSGMARMAIAFFGLDTTTTPPTDPTTPPPSGECTATVSLNSWTGGYVATVRVTAGAAALSGWTVSVPLPTGSAVTSTWNAGATGSSGTVSFRNVAYNGTVPAGGSVEFGFQGTGSGPGAAPACQAA
ncbi:extracellular catalytic domain type 1 short-chain-length polyhydroxyalkanoate depolymerase [Symbioplanes lichenis]|uniref:extracellular catalytic domain type 1 short-chain-length polyhydroxyalkanoate depolymerase n=1 Tax=Symbioplanes lichenis TaxID=1629072 RepID=UPI0027387E47|nr:PHB depolymerase family esterase [Actinoplanes lichenis]